MFIELKDLILKIDCIMNWKIYIRWRNYNKLNFILQSFKSIGSKNV